MAAGLHGSARTTPRVRAELQTAQASSRALAAQYGLNLRTVLKWRKRTSTADAAMGPATPRSTVLTEAEEAMVVEFRKSTLLQSDEVRRFSRKDVLGCLREAIPKLTRSALHRSSDANQTEESVRFAPLGLVWWTDSPDAWEPSVRIGPLGIAVMDVVHLGLCWKGVVARPSPDSTETRMDVHENARTTRRSRLLMVHRVLQERRLVRAVAAEFGVDRSTVGKRVVRYRREGEAGLRDRSSRPHRSPPGSAGTRRMRSRLRAAAA